MSRYEIMKVKIIFFLKVEEDKIHVFLIFLVKYFLLETLTDLLTPCTKMSSMSHKIKWHNTAVHM